MKEKPMFTRKIGPYRVFAYPDKIVVRAVEEPHFLPEDAVELPVWIVDRDIEAKKGRVSVRTTGRGQIELAIEVWTSDGDTAISYHASARVPETKLKEYFNAVYEQANGDLSFDLELSRIGRKARGTAIINGRKYRFSADAFGFKKDSNGLVVSYRGGGLAALDLSPSLAEVYIDVNGHRIRLAKKVNMPEKTLKSVAKWLMGRKK